MRWAWVALGLCLCASAPARPPGPAGPAKEAPGTAFGFLELSTFAKDERGEPSPIVLYLAYPETLGAVPVRAFLQAPEARIKPALEAGLWTAKPLTRSEKELLLALRALAHGRIGAARDHLAAAKNLPRRLLPCRRNNSALLLHLLGLPEDAESEWRRALGEGGPAAEGAWRNLYSLYLARKDFAKAHGLVNATLQKSPKNDWAVAAKGYLLSMLRSDEELEEFLRRNASWKDSLFTIQIAYGRFLKERGQWEEAAKFYARGLEGNPKNGQAWLELADAYYRMDYLIFAQKSIHTAFKQGISDPYVFELYGRVLVDLASYADSGRVLERFGVNLTPEWAAAQWKLAEKLLEEGLPKDLHSRPMAQLLYRLYCRNSKPLAARELRAHFWFHFPPPAPPAKPPRLDPGLSARAQRLQTRWSYVTFPYVAKLQVNDFYEQF